MATSTAGLRVILGMMKRNVPISQKELTEPCPFSFSEWLPLGRLLLWRFWFFWFAAAVVNVRIKRPAQTQVMLTGSNHWSRIDHQQILTQLYAGLGEWHWPRGDSHIGRLISPPPSINWYWLSVFGPIAPRLHRRTLLKCLNGDHPHPKQMLEMKTYHLPIKTYFLLHNQLQSCDN